jgi:hypothetical protein
VASVANNVAAAYRRLRGLGLTAAQAAGAVGGLTGESGPNLDPHARNPSSGAIGIGQWLGGRAKGVRPGDFQGQLKHLVDELKGSERGALAALKGAKTAAQAAEIFTRHFERPSAGEIASSLPARQRAAERILAQHGGDAGTTGSSKEAPDSGLRITGTVTPGGEQPSRAAAVAQVLSKHSSVKGSLKRGSRLKEADYLFKAGLATEPTPVTATQQITQTGGAGHEAAATRAAAGGGLGDFHITGPNPGRLKPELTSFARKVAGVYGSPLTGSDGSGHSRLTVNGNVSEHTTGNATDIPARGAKLVSMGRAALIAAGMPRAQAMKQSGGLFNVGNHQIIFNTHAGGDHTDHLHISAHAARR